MSSAIHAHVRSARARLGLTTLANRFVLTAERGDHPVRFVVDAVPSVRGARVLVRSVRQIHRVTFCRSGDVWTATADVTVHRLPHTMPVSIRTAVALALRGHCVEVCPALLDTEGGADDGRVSL